MPATHEGKRLPGHFAADLGKGGRVHEHVGVGGIGEGAVALLGLNAGADRIGLFAEPDALDVIIDAAQVEHVVGAYAAGPDVAVGVDLGGGPSRVAGYHLGFLGKDALDQLVVAHSEGLGHFGDAGKLLALDASDQFVDGRGVFVAGRGDADANGVELDALLGDLGYVGVGLKAERVIIELAHVVYVEAGDDGVDADAEVGVVELAKSAVVGLELFEVAR